MKNLYLFFLILLATAVYSQTTKILNIGCRSLSADGQICLNCSSRFYKDQSGICQPVPTFCQTYN